MSARTRLLLLSAFLGLGGAGGTLVAQETLELFDGKSLAGWTTSGGW